MAVSEIVIPQTDVNDTTVLISKWLVADGAQVKAGDALVAFEASKASVELESPGAGFVRHRASKGATVPVGAVVALLADSAAELETQAAPAAAATPAGDIRASKKAQELAAQHGIDLGTLGVTGIISEKHVQQAIAEGRGKGGAPAAGGAVPPPAEVKPWPVVSQGGAAPATPSGVFIMPMTAPAAEEPAGPSQAIAVTRVQAAVARQVQHSLQTRAHAFVIGRYEVDATMKALEKLLEREKRMIGFADVVVFHTARCLREFPRFNSAMLGDTIHEYEQVNVSFTVDINGRLYTPVIHDADKLTLAEISAKMMARKMEIMRGAPQAASLAGGTFTISVLDQPSLLWQLPIINRAQGAILGVGARMREFVPAADDTPRIAHTAGLCLSYDHRLLNGADAARFLSSMGERLANDPETPKTDPV